LLLESGIIKWDQAPDMAKRAVIRRTTKAHGSTNGDPKITMERLWAVALDEIDSRGLEAFSLRNVARTLGVYPRAIYWHVKNRNELLSGMVAYALRDIYPPASSMDWKAWVRKLLVQYRKAIQRHPNIAPLVGASIMSGGGINADTIEIILSVLSKAGFEGERLLDAYNVVVAAQVGFVTLELAALPLEDIGSWAAEYRKQIGTIDVLRYPVLSRNLPMLANRAFMLRWSNGTEVPLDRSFERFVDVVIKGLEQNLSNST
jgi:TetR/AcrR family transcriptional regulator, tetracycline repressor protein